MVPRLIQPHSSLASVKEFNNLCPGNDEVVVVVVVVVADAVSTFLFVKPWYCPPGFTTSFPSPCGHTRRKKEEEKEEGRCIVWVNTASRSPHCSSFDLTQADP
ncbi:hypothetical protein E2C01_088510 [Portunus trituberculatus]|uniref:Uncharacterized protein n=1 Tax=Portunus trituberculatus TaxID=210409 RepID=A0A5B7JM31_PORTR|nr:hypothetical protein [Portunus trituberculatus]